MKKQIVITISPEGAVVIAPEGFSDGSCRAATEAIEKALGGVTERKAKGECVVEVSEKVKAK